MKDARIWYLFFKTDLHNAIFDHLSFYTFTNGKPQVTLILGFSTVSGNCCGLLVNLWRKGEIIREKVGRCQVYFANDPHKSANQRRALTAQHSPKSFSAEMAVLILAVFIRNPDSSFEQLAEKVSRSKNVTVSPEQIEHLFEQQGLKKTMQAAVPGR